MGPDLPFSESCRDPLPTDMCYHFADQAACFVFPDGLMSLSASISQHRSEPLFISHLILPLLRKPLPFLTRESGPFPQLGWPAFVLDDEIHLSESSILGPCVDPNTTHRKRQENGA